MIGTIRKHQQWLWIIIILAIIVSFVIYFSPNSTGIFSGGDTYNFGTIKGRAITREEFRNAQSEMYLFYFLRAGKWPTKEELEQTGFNLERETYNRILIVEKMNELNVHPSPEAIAKWIADLFRSKNETTFPKERFDTFVKTELKPHNLTVEDFYRFARHQIGQQHLVSVYGLSGKLIAPQEAESFYRRLNEPMSAEAVIFSATNYLGKVSVTPAALSQFYSNNMAEYRLPERLVVNYVKWNTSNFLAEADKELNAITNLSERLEAAYFQSGGTNRYKDATGKPLSMEAAIKEMKEEERQQLALISAHKKAAEFVEGILQAHGENNPIKPGDFESAAKSKGLEVKTTPPFSQNTTTNELKLPAQFIQAAFTLHAEDSESLFTHRPVIAPEGVYVIGFKQRFASEIQPFDKVRDQVTKDFRADTSLKLARDAGAAFEKAVTNGIAQGKTFSAIAKEANVTPVELPQFSLSTRSLPGVAVNLDTLQNVANTLPTGKTSDFIATAEGGFVLHLKARLPVDEAKLKAELPEFLAHQRDQRMAAAFSEWFQQLPKEMQLAIPAKSSTGN